MIYKILKLLKTTNKTIFETEILEELKSKCEVMELKNYNKPYFYTSIRCEDIKGKQYALTAGIKTDIGTSIPVSPDKIALLFNL